MKIKEHINEFTKDKVYQYTLDSGLNVYILPKKNINKKLCMYGTKYGSNNNSVYIDDKEKLVPEGIAHFLEHKLFDQENEDIMQLFSNLGIEPNAYTTYDHTVYYFETTEDIEKPLNLLIRMVNTPYFTENSVKKEKGIIAQEINMYKDKPEYQAMISVVKNLYINNPVRNDITGTIESISKIRKEDLYNLYNYYYSLKNMFLIVIGNVNKEDIINNIEENFKNIDRNTNNIIKNELLDSEVYDKVNKSEEIIISDINIPRISIGFKFKKNSGEENIKINLAIELIGEIFFGRLSNFYHDNYNEGIIDDHINFIHESGNNFSYINILALTQKEDKLKETIINYIEDIKNINISDSLLDTFKRKIIGNMIYDTEDFDNTSYEIIKSIINNTNIYQETKLINEITPSYIKKVIKNIFDKNNMSITIITNNR